MVLDDWRVSTLNYGGQPWLNPASSQQIAVGSVNAAAEALSNSTLLDCTVGGSCNNKPPKIRKKPTIRNNNVLMQ